MDANMPTEPLPPAQQPQPGYPPQAQYVQQPASAHYQPHADEPFYKRYGLAFAISTLILGAFVILAFVGAGALAVGSVISHGVSISHGIEGKFPQQLVPRGQGQGKGQGQGQGGGSGQGQHGTVPGPNSGNQVAMVRGTITSISGDTWTIDTQRGASVTVQVTSSTQFGTPNQTQSASDFAVGDGVIVLGTRSGNTVTAIRVLGLSSFKQPLPATPGTPVTPGPSPSK
ncbi:MAG: DUF5666 domain-containing protein [Leifsonia sp.]